MLLPAWSGSRRRVHSLREGAGLSNGLERWVSCAKALCAAALAIAMLAGSTGCRQSPPATIEPPEDLSDLVGALESLGREPRVWREEGPDDEGAERSRLTIGAEEMIVFSFPDAHSRETFERSLQSHPVSALPWPQGAGLWTSGALAVVYAGEDGGVILMLDALLGDRVRGEAAGPDEPHPPAVTAARQALAEMRGLDPRTIAVLDFEPRTWPDACLGAAREGEICADVETPGWWIAFGLHGEVVEVHTDEVGDRVRLP